MAGLGLAATLGDVLERGRRPIVPLQNFTTVNVRPEEDQQERDIRVSKASLANFLDTAKTASTLPTDFETNQLQSDAANTAAKRSVELGHPMSPKDLAEMDKDIAVTRAKVSLATALGNAKIQNELQRGVLDQNKADLALANILNKGRAELENKQALHAEDLATAREKNKLLLSQEANKGFKLGDILTRKAPDGTSQIGTIQGGKFVPIQDAEGVTFEKLSDIGAGKKMSKMDELAYRDTLKRADEVRGLAETWKVVGDEWKTLNAKVKTGWGYKIPGAKTIAETGITSLFQEGTGADLAKMNAASKTLTQSSKLIKMGNLTNKELGLLQDSAPNLGYPEEVNNAIIDRMQRLTQRMAEEPVFIADLMDKGASHAEAQKAWNEKISSEARELISISEKAKADLENAKTGKTGTTQASTNTVRMKYPGSDKVYTIPSENLEKALGEGFLNLDNEDDLSPEVDENEEE